MATIAASVGRLGANRPDDARTIQGMLNRIPRSSGGPSPLLVVDSICGPKTIDAIHQFQSLQFGWAKADGRVDPAGPTLRKLNELLDGSVPSGKRGVITLATTITCPHGARVFCQPVGGRRDMGPDGSPMLTPMDLFVVAGCPFQLGPCVRVEWLETSQFLNNDSVGLSVGIAGDHRGPVSIQNNPKNIEFVHP